MNAEQSAPTGNIRASQKPWRLISEIRDADFRPLIFSVPDVLAKIEEHAFTPIGPLRGHIYGGEPGLLAGCFGAVCYVDGETETERFRILLPFANELKGIDQDGKRRTVKIECFENMRIELDGAVRVLPKVWLRNVTFGLVDLPFGSSMTRLNLALIFSRFANDTGLSNSALGRDLPTLYPDYPALSQIEVRDLDAVMRYVAQHWHSLSSDTPPSRETIAANLAALSLRMRSRGRHARRK